MSFHPEWFPETHLRNRNLGARQKYYPSDSSKAAKYEKANPRHQKLSTNIEWRKRTKIEDIA